MISLEIHVRSLFTGELEFTGVALRAAFLSLLKQSDPELSKKLHDASSVQAYAIHPFDFGTCFKTQFVQGEEYSFTVHILDTEESGHSVRGIIMNRDALLDVYHQKMMVTQIDITRRSPDGLMSQWIKEEVNQDIVRLPFMFKTPTQLSQYGSDCACLLPVPERVFPALLRIWNTVSGATRVERVTDYRDWVEQNVSVSRHRIRTTELELGRKRSFVGFIGEVVYNVRNAQEPFGRLTAGLAHFAELSNIGKNRTAGFGMVRLLTRTENRSRELRGQVRADKTQPCGRQEVAEVRDGRTSTDVPITATGDRISLTKISTDN